MWSPRENANPDIARKGATAAAAGEPPRHRRVRPVRGAVPRPRSVRGNDCGAVEHARPQRCSNGLCPARYGRERHRHPYDKPRQERAIGSSAMRRTCAASMHSPRRDRAATYPRRSFAARSSNRCAAPCAAARSSPTTARLLTMRPRAPGCSRLRSSRARCGVTASSPTGSPARCPLMKHASAYSAPSAAHSKNR